MKKLLTTLIAALLIGFHANAASYEFPYLTFVTNSGETTLSVEALTISISESNLIVTNESGTQTFALQDLTKMYFSSSITGVNSVITQEDGEVEVFALNGVSMGKYANTNTAIEALKSGVYVLKANGKTIKIAVK